MSENSKESVSKNYNKGEVITDPSDLLLLAIDRKSVFHSGCWGVKPAAVIQNMNFTIVMKAIRRGQLFEIERKTIPTKE